MFIERYVEGEFHSLLEQYRQMIFLSGPRQVGKTTAVRNISNRLPLSHYLNWDNVQHRQRFLHNPTDFASEIGLDQVTATKIFCLFDELHKFSRWRDFLKGLHDSYSAFNAVVTGSAQLNVFWRGGDSLRGRYFSYTLHPLSIAELVRSLDDIERAIVTMPKKISDDRWEAFWQFGGFPEPFQRANKRFHNRWTLTFNDQVLREEVRDLTRVRELSQIESLALHIRDRVGQMSNYLGLARSVQSSVDSVRRWTTILESLYFCYRVTPWYRNVARSLRKEPKFYLWDWSQVQDAGAKAENIVASALLKSVNWWTESGLGNYSLHFLRDTQKREVDFIVVRDGQPWFLVEVKSGSPCSLSPQLGYFQKQVGADHAFQVSFEASFESRNCFDYRSPIQVPAKTFLSQLV
ncbi:MAG: AAA family ATPase [Gammaproteobacteria bacterium]|nr:AAA family ATPase [Gammaproteobacteria bacterium]